MASADQAWLTVPPNVAPRFACAKPPTCRGLRSSRERESLCSETSPGFDLRHQCAADRAFRPPLPRSFREVSSLCIRRIRRHALTLACRRFETIDAWEIWRLGVRANMQAPLSVGPLRALRRC